MKTVYLQWPHKKYKCYTKYTISCEIVYFFYSSIVFLKINRGFKLNFTVIWKIHSKKKYVIIRILYIQNKLELSLT